MEDYYHSQWLSKRLTFQSRVWFSGILPVIFTPDSHSAPALIVDRLITSTSIEVLKYSLNWALPFLTPFKQIFGKITSKASF